MADLQEKQVLQYLLYKPLVSMKELEKIYATVYKSMPMFLSVLSFQTNKIITCHVRFRARTRK